MAHRESAGKGDWTWRSLRRKFPCADSHAMLVRVSNSRRDEHMKLKVAFAVGLLLLTVMSFSCSRHPAELARRIATTDYVIASDWYRGARRIIKGEEATRLVKAISSGRLYPPWASAPTAPSCKLEFYRDKNLLASIEIQEEWYSDGSVECTDRTGVLKAVQRDLEENEQARRDWANLLAGRILRGPDFARLQMWSTEMLERYGKGQVKLVRDSSDQLDSSEIPDWLEAAFRSAWLMSPRVWIHLGSTGRAECLLMDGPHYGLLVGDTNFTATFKAWYLTNAAPGIYVYSSAE